MLSQGDMVTTSVGKLMGSFQSHLSHNLFSTTLPSKSSNTDCA